MDGPGLGRRRRRDLGAPLPLPPTMAFLSTKRSCRRRSSARYGGDVDPVDDVSGSDDVIPSDDVTGSGPGAAAAAWSSTLMKSVVGGDDAG